jgi:vacuolar iron transporter family protein
MVLGEMGEVHYANEVLLNLYQKTKLMAGKRGTGIQAGNKTQAEPHTVGQGALFRDIILGGQDGVVNVLGIVLGVATATDSAQIVMLSGLAATFAESVSMAAVAYTSSRAEVEHYHAEVEREKFEMENLSEVERQEIRDIYTKKGFTGRLLEQVVDKICSDKQVWLDTMMREELKIENPEEGMTPLRQGILVGGSALIGSFIPIIPFMAMGPAEAIPVSLAASLAVLFLVGAYKSKLTSGKWLHGGMEMMLIGGAAAFAGYLVGVLFQVKNP